MTDYDFFFNLTFFVNFKIWKQNKEKGNLQKWRHSQLFKIRLHLSSPTALEGFRFDPQFFEYLKFIFSANFASA